jgi:CTP synthase (UTP-ammonia lyase)
MVKIGIIGDYDPQRVHHTATNDSLEHAAAVLNLELRPEWIPTPTLEDKRILERLNTYNGLWCSPGSPYLSMSGALNAIRFARENDWPFIGT